MVSHTNPITPAAPPAPSPPSAGRLGGAAPARRESARSPARAPRPATLPQTFTLVLALVTLAVGELGLHLPYARPFPRSAPPEPVQARLIQVEINDPPPAPAAAAAPHAPKPDAPPPEPAPTPAPPPLPAMPSLPNPSAAMAFAVPTEVRPQPVEPAAVAPAATAPTAPPAANASSVRRLTFGQGEGRQPAPVYPRRAIAEGQEGVVLVRFTVGPDGGVLIADVASPSRWPLLNQAALAAVRDSWHFPAGPVRLYEVSIRFKFNSQ